jgi:DNA-binding MarR family transcriptional regulator
MSAEPGIEILNLVNTIERGTTARMQRLLRETGVELAAMEARTLRFVARHPGCTQNEIVRASGRDKAQIARIIKILRERGLVDRPAAGSGRRAQPLALTAAGAAVHERAESLRADIARELVSELAPAERTQLEALLGRLAPLAPAGED